MTFQPKRQIPNTGSSQSIVRSVFLFFAKSFDKVYIVLRIQLCSQVEGLNLRILGNAEMETAETNAMDAWQF